MLLLGIDVGTSSIKISVVDAANGQTKATASWPEQESEIIALRPGWAEQSPDTWWEDVQKAIQLCHSKKAYDPQDIAAIGIAYQMHGLVMTDKDQNSLRNSIIWCDSRAVETGEQAFEAIGKERALQHLLNSPGNFTASKLAWVKANEPEVYAKADKIMLPGDYIALKLTGAATTSTSALSEGVFWDFISQNLSGDVMDHYGFSEALIPEIRPVFSAHGHVSQQAAAQLGLKAGIPVSYKAGDQPNNALSLNVTEPGEVAATAGTSGVIYGVTDHLLYDKASRVNTFAHVNYTSAQQRLGVLLCINGTGSMYRWAKAQFGGTMDYNTINQLSATAPAGSKGLRVLPFGNGAERMLNNKIAGAHFHNIDLNLHNTADLFRAVQEGIAFAFRYGLDILRENGMQPAIIRAGRSNLFLSQVFTQTFVDITGVPVELHENDGSYGAAIGAGIGAGYYKNAAEAFTSKKPLGIITPGNTNLEAAYQEWKSLLNKILSH